VEFERQMRALDPVGRLELAEKCLAAAKRMIGAGKEKLNPENAKALRDLEEAIQATRAGRGKYKDLRMG
jgi:hypothetical protein